MFSKLVIYWFLTTLLIFLSSVIVIAQIDTVKFNKYYFKKYFTDTKAIVVSPTKWKGNDWAKVGIFVASEVGLSFADQSVKDYCQSHKTDAGIYVSKNILRGFGAERSLYFLSGMFAYGLLTKNEREKSTALLALESFVLSSLIVRVPKALVGRERPDNWRGDGPFAFNGLFGGNSYPSGHTTSSFAVASVIATQYRDSKWIPATAYTVAGLAGLSRVYDNKHWLTDVIAGATIGTLVGNLVSRRSVNSKLTIVPFDYGNIQGMRLVYAF